MQVAAVSEADERGAVVGKAVLRAAEQLGLSARRLAAVLGTSEPTVSRLKAGSFQLDPAGKPFELAVLLIRVFRSLDAIAGGDAGVMRAWMRSDNTALGGRPIDRVASVVGLVDVLAYLDARRALV
ncbi:DUF2384 domain-containing protein [Devosia sp. PTR5]|uniref:DUF2384 domain-containing protein n=1 Tax=Devosia oryzisoli TaxID=2774138 RepID=A0A927FTY5_9HYPH|nr:DUF2384 domain-containing protein [Devosia oryzisoli]